MDNELELGEIPQDARQQIPEVCSSNNTNKYWSTGLVMPMVSSMLCFPPLGILNLIKSRQHRKQKLSQDTLQAVSRDSRQIAYISCFMGAMFVVMVTVVMLLQFLYFQLKAEDMESSWRREYYFTTVNLTTKLSAH